MEELGNDIYPAAKEVLLRNGIKLEKHMAKQMTKDDYKRYDYIIVMEERNKRDVLRIIGDDYDNKIHLLLEYTDSPSDIEDPWYTGEFDKVYDQIYNGCIGLYNYLLDKEAEDGE